MKESLYAKMGQGRSPRAFPARKPAGYAYFCSLNSTMTT